MAIFWEICWKQKQFERHLQLIWKLQSKRFANTLSDLVKLSNSWMKWDIIAQHSYLSSTSSLTQKRHEDSSKTKTSYDGWANIRSFQSFFSLKQQLSTRFMNGAESFVAYIAQKNKVMLEKWQRDLNFHCQSTPKSGWWHFKRNFLHNDAMTSAIYLRW